MPELIHNLQGKDLGHLRIIAELWGLEFSAPDAHIGLQRLMPLLLDAENLEEVLSSLPAEAAKALHELMRRQGRIPWMLFTRRYGVVREIGPGKRDREHPYLNENASASEALWYRGLIGRGFFESSAGPEEFAYIPEDLLPFMPIVESPATPTLGRPASQSEKSRTLPINDRLLDDVCTMLAGLRMNMQPAEIEGHLRCGKNTPYPLTSEALLSLLKIAGYLDAFNQPNPEPVRLLLESGPGQALANLFEAWLRSVEFNELKLVPGLAIEGHWKNNPLQARQSVIDFISTIPDSLQANDVENKRPYWSLGAFVSAVYQANPDFQRPAGDYDSWYVREVDDGKFLRGFEHWHEVDGVFLKFMIGGPLHWLGIFDLAMPENEQIISAFRFSDWADDLLNFKAPTGLKEEEQSVTVRADGRLRMPPQTSRVGRYQLARFCEWQEFNDGFYRYRITPASLEAARKQGLKVDHLLVLLNRFAQATPPSLVTALKRWESHGSLVRIDRLVVLRFKQPEALAALRASSAQRFLGESLGPTAVVIKPGGWEKVSMVLAELGYLAETHLNE
ncbi:MAG TPA: helicase-associated domain-containing protein [Anaerolineales bacterium]|nr:helicase-associated domain-containing protein [Anaerolineales bacterium]